MLDTLNTHNKSKNILIDQLSAGYVLRSLQLKQEELTKKISEIALTASTKTQESITALSNALKCIENVRDFAAPSNYEHILGRMETKHGEIAEHVEVEIRNGWDILKKLCPSASLNVGRTAPEDYVINNTPVQSKFIAGFNKSLQHVIEHLQKYPSFAKDATAYGYPGESGYYHIPKDQYETIIKILHGDVGEFNSKTINKCKQLVEFIEENTGKHFIDVVKPSISNYHDVQIGTVNNTLDDYETQFKEYHKEEISEINSEERLEIEKAQHITDASWAEAAKAGGVAALIGGTVSGGIKLYSKIKERSNITQLSVDDWKDVGIDFTKGSVRGGISGISIYCLTKLGGFSAPFAGSIVTTSLGVTSLAIDYRSGKISKSDFSQAACSLSVEAGMAAVGTAIGQTVIPIPIVGAIVGTMASRAVIEISRYVFSASENDLIKKMENDYCKLISELDIQSKEILSNIDSYYSNFSSLIDAAMDPNVNLRLNASIELCRVMNIQEAEIIHNSTELDRYMQE